MRPAALFLGLIVLLAVGDAAAQGCTPGAFIDAYRKGEAAYGRKDFAAAAAQFRPLAEQGLGPAQLRLGQILSGDSGKPDLVEAYRWTALADDVGTLGAKEALAKLTPRLTQPQIAQANIAPATWQPAALSPCLAVDPRVKRPDGTSSYNLDLLVNHVLSAKSAVLPAVQRFAWLARNLESVRVNSPRYLVYFKALYGIGFVGGPGSFVVTEQRDNLPMLVINEGYTGEVSAERLAQLVSAAVYAVHVALVPTVITADVQTYNGHTIRTTTTEGGRRFLEFVKFAIDMAEQLPPDLAGLARQTELRYEPQRPFDNRNGAVALGTFTHDSKTGQGYMAYTENFAMRGPAQIVITLVGGGIYLRRDKDAAEARHALDDARKRNDAAAIAKAQQRVDDLKKASAPDPAHGDCELEDYEIKTMEALKLDAIEINRRYKARFSRGCS
jgi:hypothetical protein